MKAPHSLRVLIAARWAGYLAALAAVTLVSLFIGLALGGARIANISMLYLIGVFAVAIAYGRGPAVLASLAAFLTFDWFFVEPLHAITVSNPDEWVALLLFLLTAIVTGQLTAAVRRRALEAEQREREAAVLYDVVRLISERDFVAALQAVADRLRTELTLSAVVIDLPGGDHDAVRAEVGEPDALAFLRTTARLPADRLTVGKAPIGAQRGTPGHWVRIVPSRRPGQPYVPAPGRVHLVPVTVREQRVGALLLVRPADGAPFSSADTRLLTTVSGQLGLAAERVRLALQATEAEILRRTDELKSALINAVSHDLRTPLASIIASAGSLRQQDVHWTDGERQEFAEAIEEEAQRLDRIVGNLLDLSRIEAGHLRPDKGWYDLSALLEDVLGRLRPITAGHPVSVDVPEELPPVSLDYVEIDQVLSNLVENAAKYTPSGTPIALSIKHQGDEIEVAVADRGPGIPAESLPRLFDPFYRVDRPGPRPQGTGVGLAVAKGLIEAHGGHLWAENGPQGGARFAFTLPLSAAVAVAPGEPAA